MKRKARAAHGEKKSLDNEVAASYDAFEEFEGRRYTGMRVGRGHKWNYDAGAWTEKKVTPDQWRSTLPSPSGVSEEPRKDPASPWERGITGTSSLIRT